MLLVEDDPPMAEIVSTALRARGNEVAVAVTGREALELASATEPDVVVLDLGLPDIDGVDVCRQLRRWFPNPILVLSADGDERRKVAALDEGADDYLTKPFSMPELLARLRVAARHRAALGTAVDPGPIVVGDLRVDPGAHLASVGGEPVHLARKEFALLAVLARNPGRAVTHSRLVAQVWGRPGSDKTEALRGLAARLRRKLGDGDARPTVEAVAGVGYRLAPPPQG